MNVRDNDDGLHGRELLKGAILVSAFGAVYMGWKFIKHNWLVDHGYLPEAMRDYWLVIAAAFAILVAWGVATKFRS